MNLSQVINHHAVRFRDHPAITTDDGQLTYRDLHHRSQECAGALRALGVGRGDVVAVLLYNRVEFIELMLGCAQVGAIFMPLNWRLAGPELDYVINHAGVRLIVSEPTLHDRLEAATGQRTWVTLGAEGGRWTSLEAVRRSSSPLEDAESVDVDQVMRLMYTSGTTSRPKGVMISYGNLYWKCASQVVELEISAGDRGLACGPLYHVGALDMVTTNLLFVGGTTHLIPRFDAAAVLEQIERHRLTLTWLAPAMVNAILACSDLNRRDLTSMRLIQNGGEKMPLTLIKKVITAFPNAWFADAYGMTETVSGDTYLDKGRMVGKLGSVGRPVMFTEVRVVDPDDNPVPPGEQGEVVLRGPKVCKGYWKDPEATTRAIRHGWLHSGDIGVLDDEGYLYIVDRLKDLIISGGENIASSEIERVIYEHDAVLEAAVIGRPDERWGEVPVAYVVLREATHATAEDLDRHCRARLAKFKAPKAFQFIKELPRNPSGKVLKRELRKLELKGPDLSELT